MSSDVRAVGLPCDRLVQPFRARLVDRSPTTVPHHWRDGFSFLRLCDLYRVLRSRPASDYRFDPKVSRRSTAPLLGFDIPHHDLDRRCPLGAAPSQATATFRPRRFSHPRRFTPPSASRACFIPLPCSGFSLQGVSLSTEPLQVSLAVALVPLDSPSSGVTQARRRALDFKALLSARVRLPTQAVKPTPVPCPSWASPPPGVLPAHRRDVFTPLPPRTFAATYPPRWAFGVLPMR